MERKPWIVAAIEWITARKYNTIDVFVMMWCSLCINDGAFLIGALIILVGFFISGALEHVAKLAKEEAE